MRIATTVPQDDLRKVKAAAKAVEADGYTIITLSAVSMSTWDLMAREKPPYDLDRDFDPVGLMANSPELLAHRERRRLSGRCRSRRRRRRRRRPSVDRCRSRPGAPLFSASFFL